MTTVTGSLVSQRVQKRYRLELLLITCGKCGQKIVMEYKVSKEGVNKGSIFYMCPDYNVSYFQTFAYICVYFFNDICLYMCILLNNEDTPWLRQYHNQGSYIKKFTVVPT